MADLNKVTIIGRLGKDPEIRNVGDSSVANLRVATSEKWNDKRSGEKKEKTEWHSVVAWGDGLVDFIEKYVPKGALVYVEGKLQTRKWEDKDGVEKYSTEIVLQGFGSRLDLLSTPNKGNGGDEDEDERPARRASNGSASKARDEDERPARRSRDEDERPARRSSTDTKAPARRTPRDDLDDDIPF